MILDSSAVVALLLQEPGYRRLQTKVGAAASIGMGTANLLEASIVLAARLDRDAHPLLARFIQETDTAVIPFSEAHYSAAYRAWWTYGKGRHPAALNFGDCAAYATALLAAEPLLCTGDDFPQTDLELA